MIRTISVVLLGAIFCNLSSAQFDRDFTFADGRKVSFELFVGHYKPDQRHDPELHNHALKYRDFIAKYKKSYINVEEAYYRFEIFRENVRQLEAENVPTLGITKFTDLRHEEARAMLMGHRRLKDYPYKQKNHCKDRIEIPLVDVPEHLDYTEEGLVTSVKNQNPCGSCWAFGSIANIEGQYAKKHNKLVNFSEQQLVDCFEFHSCEEGYNGILADSLLMDMGGVETYEDYPYISNVTGKAGNCTFDKSKVKAVLTGCDNWRPETEDDLAKVLVYIGPLSVGVAGDILPLYQGGVLKKSLCFKANITDHEVLLTGFGVDNATGEKYWKIKNSWGENWGEDGYFRIPFGINCLQINNFDGLVLNAIVD